MSYSSTVDEKYGGGWSSLSSDDLDASNLLNSTFVLADGSIGYGNSTNAIILPMKMFILWAF